MIEFLTAYPIYTVLAVVLSIWTGLFIYLYRLDQKLSKLELMLGEASQRETN